MYRFADCCWISLVIGGGSADWEFRMRGNLTYREDTGLVNSPPVVNIPPLIQIQQGGSHTIKIPGSYNYYIIYSTQYYSAACTACSL